jgi:Domain of unknown function (DUF892)
MRRAPHPEVDRTDSQARVHTADPNFGNILLEQFGGANGVLAAAGTAQEPEMIEELLIDHLRDLLHAEGQLVKALPKNGQGGTQRDVADGVRDTHLDDTKLQV